MNGQSAVQNNGANGHAPIMVVVPSNGAYRVYPAANPAAVAFVGGTADNPTCTCAEFRSDEHEWGRCAHTAAVFGQHAQMPPSARAPQSQPPHPAATVNGNGESPELPVQLVLKRSVSPDGRIDSLSIEVHQTVESGEIGEVMQKAVNALTLEDQIVGFFLQKRGRPQPTGDGHSGNGHAPTGNGYGPGDTPVSAELSHVGGTQTRNGYSLYINVRVNGRDARLFGSADKLAGYISDAGYQSNAFHLAKDSQLRLPCQVVLDRKTNSKYPVIERVLPQASMAGAGRSQ